MTNANVMAIFKKTSMAGLLGVALVGAMVFLAVTSKQIPPELNTALGFVLAYFFGKAMK